MATYFGEARVTQGMIDAWQKPWIEWRDSTGGSNEDQGYSTYIASINQAISDWTAAKNAATYAAALVYFSYSGCLDPANEVAGALVSDEPTMYVDCVNLTSLPDAIINPSGDHPFQDDQDASLAVETLWAQLDTYLNRDGKIKSAVGSGSFYVPSLLYFYFQARGVVYDEDYFILARQFQLAYAGQNPPETTEFKIKWIDGQTYRFPGPVNYTVAKIDSAGDFGTSSGISIAVRVSGRLREIPATFGATITPPTFDGDKIEDWGGIVTTDPYTWAGAFIRSCVGVVPEGFEDFAGRYNTHPIVTGINAKPPRPAAEDEDGQITELAELTYVNNYVNTTYSYKADEEDYDYWQFLSDAYSAGDCEDFALTKIQMLLDLSWDISRLQLMAGVRHDIFLDKYIGHVWVLVDGSIVLDNSGDLTTVSHMTSLGYEELRKQSGLWWSLVGWSPEASVRYPFDLQWVQYEKMVIDGLWAYEAFPWPHTSFDSAVLTAKVRDRDYGA